MSADYRIHLDDKYGQSAVVDIPAEVAANEPWFNPTLDTVTLAPHQGYTVPRGVVHRTRARMKTVIVMVENASVAPTGD
jgi:hypothetical protein